MFCCLYDIFTYENGYHMIGILLCCDILYVAVEKLCVHIVLVAKASRMSSIVHLVHVCHLRFSGDQFEEEF